MAVPTIVTVSPGVGPASGGDLVRIRGTGFDREARVRFGDAWANVVSARGDVLDVRSPQHAAAVVDVTVENALPGEVATAIAAYRFIRERLAREADLTRLVRTLLQVLKRQVLANTSLSVSMDFDDTAADGLDLVAVSSVPSLVLTGPHLRENRFYGTNEPLEEIVAGELRRRRPPLTVDVEFGLTGASDHAVELLNLLTALSAFFNRNRWIAMPRDPAALSSPLVRWEMDPVGEARTNLEGEGDVRAFTWGLVVRGMDIDEGLPIDLGRAVTGDGAHVHVGGLP